MRKKFIILLILFCQVISACTNNLEPVLLNNKPDKMREKQNIKMNRKLKSKRVLFYSGQKSEPLYFDENNFIITYAKQQAIILTYDQLIPDKVAELNTYKNEVEHAYVHHSQSSKLISKFRLLPYWLKGFSKLKSLELQNIQLKGSEISNLAFPNINYIDLEQTTIQDKNAFINNLAQCYKLEKLIIDENTLSSDELKKLQNLMPKLEILIID